MPASNPVAVGLSKISMFNLSDREVLETQLVLELYDGVHRIQVEFEDVDEFWEVVEFPADEMLDYFQNNLFESPDMADPGEALVDMARTSSEEGLVTVPPEKDDDELFDAMTEIFQKAVDHAGSNGKTTDTEDDFLQSMIKDEEEGQ
jgi:hypothetical protein